MRRGLSACVLGVFLIGSGLRAHCFLSCADAHRPEAVSGCHDEPGSQSSIGESHTCTDRAPAMAAAIKRAAPDSAGMAAVATPASGVARRSLEPRHATAEPHGPPALAPLHVPLRI
jgi:hypothetical protein